MQFTFELEQKQRKRNGKNKTVDTQFSTKNEPTRGHVDDAKYFFNCQVDRNV